MKHRRLVGLLAASAMMVMGLMFTGSAMAASTTDSCVDFGPGPVGAQNCFTSTTSSYVSFAQVRFGRNSAGSFTLVCRDHWNTFVKQGNVGTGGTRSFFTEGLFGLRNPDCTLAARAHNTRANKAARATVILIS